MLIMGDVLATVAILLGGAATGWAALLAFRLLFPSRADAAEAALEGAAGRCFAIGAAWVILGGGLSIALAGAPAPILKVLGMAGLAGLSGLSLVGGAGLSAMIARRIRTLGSGIDPFQATSRASAILVGAAFLPVLGWFVLAPLTLVATIGAGARALRRGSAVASVSDR